MLLRIISVHGEQFSGQVQKVQVPTPTGLLGIFPGHINLVSPILTGQVSYLPVASDGPKSALESFADETQYVDIQAGMLMVDHDVVTVIIDDL